MVEARACHAVGETGSGTGLIVENALGADWLGCRRGVTVYGRNAPIGHPSRTRLVEPAGLRPNAVQGAGYTHWFTTLPSLSS